MNNTAFKTKKISKIASPVSMNYTMDDDALLFDQIKSGDERAFETLFKKYYVRLSHFVFQYVENMPDAEEIAQESFLNIWEKRQILEISTSFRSYLYAAAKNKALNFIRNTNRRKGHLSVISSFRTNEEDVLSELSANEINDQLFLAVEQLPPKCRQIFQMSRIEGLKHKEIAAQMELKVKTVENQIGIALKFLRTHLSEFLKIIAVVASTININ
ncbi:MAG: RNA polymerase sigma-70 factor [Bacteroidota bacterium]